MTDQKDLIITAYTGYNWNVLKYWVNSLNLSGFTGDKVVIAYNSDPITVNTLINHGCTVLSFQRDAQTGNYVWNFNKHIVVDRFFHFWSYLNSIKSTSNYRYVITTDVKDVIFQSNPSKWIEQNIEDKSLIASSESLIYKNEPWGNDNLLQSFPFYYENLKNSTIWNCGVQAGKFDVIKDLWLQIYLMSLTSKLHNPDQAAYNILLDSAVYKSITKFVESEQGWACQAGTTVDPSKIINFRPHLLEPEPTWNGNRVLTSTGIEYSIVHQWDRIPKWKQAIINKYGKN